MFKQYSAFRFLAMLFVFSLSLGIHLFPVNFVYADDGLGDWIHDKNNSILKVLDIRKTVDSALTEMTTGFIFSAITDRSLNEASNCLLVKNDIYDLSTGRLKDKSEFPSTPVASLEALNGENMSPEGKKEKKKMIEKAFRKVKGYDDTVCDFDNSIAGGIGKETSGIPLGIYRGSGSMLSFTATLKNNVVNEPLPVNMAFFLKDYARRIPIVKDTAYAQTKADYNIIGGEVVYDIWKFTRDIALGLMSLVLLIVGLMIMTRKTVEPRTVVTVQNMLPRIAIGIVLVFFSYPIGAFFAGMFTPLCWHALWSVFSWISHTGGAAGNLNVLTSAVFNPLLAISEIGMGLFSALAAIALLLVSLILMIVVLVRSLLIYLKILMSIVVAPIQFTLGVLPGKESSTVDWFKSILADTLSAPAMFAMISFGWLFGYASFTGTAINWANAGGDFGEDISRLFSGLFTPMIMMYCLMTALKMPGKVQKMIMGDKRR